MLISYLEEQSDTIASELHRNLKIRPAFQVEHQLVIESFQCRYRHSVNVLKTIHRIEVLYIWL